MEVVLIKKKESGRAAERKGGKGSSSSARAKLDKEVDSSKTAKRVRKKGFETSDLVDKYFDQLYSYLGLESLNIDQSLARRIIEEVLYLLYKDVSSKPTLEAILKKIDRFKQEIYGLIAYRLATELREFSSDVLDFIVYNGGKYIVGEISSLYRIASRTGRSDLVPVLVSIWEKFGNTTPVKCPRCGFRSVAPDQSCSVCGHVVTEDYIRKELGFEDKLRIFLSYADEKDLRDIIDLGVVLVSDSSILNPRGLDKRKVSGKLLYQISLRKSDYLLIIEEISKRRSSG